MIENLIAEIIFNFHKTINPHIQKAQQNPNMKTRRKLPQGTS